MEGFEPPRRGDQERVRDNLMKRKDMLLELFPCLRTYLCYDRYADGTDRQTASLTIFVQDGLVKAWLNDRERGRSACVSGESLEAAFTILEQQLHPDRLEWRPNRSRSRK